ncbi:MAG: hypothetical protein HYU54_00385 [Actinobacteria bacterium]|nr:hypothetical protein [Actinomycetota bacterium]
MRARLLTLAALLVGAILASSAASATTPSGPMTIVTKIDFSTEPFHGTFKVEEGKDILGCRSGTFVDFPSGASVDKVFSCSTGGRGTFVANFRPCTITVTPEMCTGTWNFDSSQSTGDFVGLHGAGDFTVVFDPKKPAGVETLTGLIHYD